MKKNQHNNNRPDTGPHETTKKGLDKLPEFNFDEWLKLHSDDPVAFEEKRELWLDTVINSAPTKYQRRLHGLMFKINTIRQREKNPLQTCVKISDMMMDSLSDLGFFLGDLSYTLQGGQSDIKSQESTAKILEFVR